MFEVGKHVYVVMNTDIIPERLKEGKEPFDIKFVEKFIYKAYVAGYVVGGLDSGGMYRGKDYVAYYIGDYNPEEVPFEDQDVIGQINQKYVFKSYRDAFMVVFNEIVKYLQDSVKDCNDKLDALMEMKEMVFASMFTM